MIELLQGFLNAEGFNHAADIQKMAAFGAGDQCFCSLRYIAGRQDLAEGTEKIAFVRFNGAPYDAISLQHGRLYV